MSLQFPSPYKPVVRFVPQSLFGRLVLILLGGLIVAQLVSAVVNFAERDRMLLHAAGMQSARRIAEIVKVLDSLPPEERRRIVGILNVPPQVVTLGPGPSTEDTGGDAGVQAYVFSATLRRELGEAREIKVATRAASAGMPPGFAPGRHRMLDGALPMPGMHRFMLQGVFFMTQVRLGDGTWVRFDTHLPEASLGLPGRVLLTLGILLAAVLALSVIAVRWVTRPLHVLAEAAEELGRDIHRPPLPENGPLEVRRAARSFNTMQARLMAFIRDRTRILAAMSHDMKTPITRMRLRADLLEDDELRRRFENDLAELESMVAETLDFMRGLEGAETAQPVDVMALLESIQADNEELEREVVIEGAALAPYVAVAPLLKRCLANLIDNAVMYGKRARVVVEDSVAALTLRVRDEGPGIPDDEQHKVFEPFYRLEGSRSRDTGGTGLGLTIARNIAQSHGGEISLCNHAGGGLEVTLKLPRPRTDRAIASHPTLEGPLHA